MASAWAAFGRLTHTAQDFYAHSNYVDLWLASHTDGSVPTPPEIEPVDPALIDSPALHSGKIYMPLEPFSLIKPLRPLVMPLLPRDSHAANAGIAKLSPEEKQKRRANLGRPGGELQPTRAAYVG